MIRVPIPQAPLAVFCRKWMITELSLFGSVLRDDFHTDSDIDVLVRFSTDSRWSLFDLMDMKDGLETIFGRRVDLIERRAVETSKNYIRRKAILSHAESVYAA